MRPGRLKLQPALLDCLWRTWIVLALVECGNDVTHSFQCRADRLQSSEKLGKMDPQLLLMLFGCILRLSIIPVTEHEILDWFSLPTSA